MEVQTIMSKQGESINNDELKEIIREADLDGDGYIDFQGEDFLYLYKTFQLFSYWTINLLRLFL